MTDDSGSELNREKTSLERDLDVAIGYNLKWSGHVDRMIGKANITICMINRTFESRDHGLWKDLYVSLGRIH